jgi:hypothetical protein
MRNTKQGSSGNLVWTSISDGVIRRLDRFQPLVASGLLAAALLGVAGQDRLRLHIIAATTRQRRAVGVLPGTTSAGYCEGQGA